MLRAGGALDDIGSEGARRLVAQVILAVVQRLGLLDLVLWHLRTKSIE